MAAVPVPRRSSAQLQRNAVPSRAERKEGEAGAREIEEDEHEHPNEGIIQVSLLFPLLTVWRIKCCGGLPGFVVPHST